MEEKVEAACASRQISGVVMMATDKTGKSWSLRHSRWVVQPRKLIAVAGKFLVVFNG